MTVGTMTSLLTKVMHGLDCCCSMSGEVCRRKCPYSEECAEMPGSGTAHLCSDALELIKEQQREIKLRRKESESRMTVTSLIDLLQKVEHKEAEVYMENSALANSLTDVIIEHDLISEEIAVILKKR